MEGEDRDAVNRFTVLYGELDWVSLVDSEGKSCCEIIVRKVLSFVYKLNVLFTWVTARMGDKAIPEGLVFPFLSYNPPSPPSVDLINPTFFSF